MRDELNYLIRQATLRWVLSVLKLFKLLFITNFKIQSKYRPVLVKKYADCVICVERSVLLSLTCRSFTSLRIPTFLCPNPRVGPALAGVGPSVCPRGPGSPAASTPQRFAWPMRKVSTKAVFATTGRHTTMSQKPVGGL